MHISPPSRAPTLKRFSPGASRPGVEKKPRDPWLFRRVLGLVVIGGITGCDPPPSTADAGLNHQVCACPGTFAGPSPGWLATPGPPDETCGCSATIYSLLTGWCLVVDGGAAPSAATPCPGFCVGDGGVISPAVPCSGGCTWIGEQCNGGSTSTCCASLDCNAPGGDGGGAAVCCGSEGFPCSPNASSCCSGSCTNGRCTAQ